MRDLRPVMRVYIAAVIAAAAFALVLAAAEPIVIGPREALVFVVLLAAAGAAQLRPVHISPKMKVTAEDAATFAAALTLGPLASMLVALLSSGLVLRFAKPASWYNRAFNAAVGVLGTGSAAWLYDAFAPDRSPISPYGVLAAALTKFVVETGLVNVVVSLQLHRTPLVNWWTIHRRDAPHHAALYALGVLAAVSVDLHPWALALFLAPVALVVLALEETARLRRQTKDAILELADLVDLRDPYTHGHSERVAALAERLARRLRLTYAQAELVREAARVHDIGKIGTTDHVLLKPGPLSDEERAEMRRHTELGHRLLRRIPEFWAGAELVLSHHERADGNGYPRGLRGPDLPMEVRVIAVADAYDAMTSDRPYRGRMSWERARAELAAGRGTQWDAEVVDAFIAMIEEERAKAVPAAAPATAAT